MPFFFLKLEQNNPNELHICHTKVNVLYFHIKDIFIIIGLRYTGRIKDFGYPNSTPSKLLENIFRVHKRDGRYQQFSWGQLEFSKMMKSLRKKFTSAK
ncbi:hypothetical protein H5410_021773 [Solanum commersonii]|uniref:Uncharacterized protein n=1 Tax=Solanum commersonii TaxID=4109 RepID=A0A9J5ZG87_SOLCO|nr:hypothetical protein H5410_021773 [Solanum commersonii]